MVAITIDWLQFTTNSKNYVNTIIQLLQLDVNTFTELEKGKLGYKRQLHNEGIFVLFEGNENMNVHVIITGQGCKNYSIDNNLLELIGRLNEKDCKATRIDLAIDDKSGDIIDMLKIRKDIKRANVVSKWKTSLEYIKRNLKDGQVIGNTINVGSRQSEIFLRIYDKSKEQGLHGKWTRMELEIKGKKAVLLQKKINTENVGFLATSLINNYIRIVEPHPTDTNKSRWKTKEYWKKIIETTEKTRLSIDREVTTLSGMKSWIERQVAPSLATITEAEGGDLEFLYNQIIEGRKRLKPKHKAIIEKEMEEIE